MNELYPTLIFLGAQLVFLALHLMIGPVARMFERKRNWDAALKVNGANRPLLIANLACMVGVFMSLLTGCDPMARAAPVGPPVEPSWTYRTPDYHIVCYAPVGSPVRCVTLPPARPMVSMAHHYSGSVSCVETEPVLREKVQ